MAEVRPKEAPGRAGVDVLAETVRANKSGVARGVVSICSANRFVLQAALERAARSGSPVLVESTSNQVNPEGGYTGIRPAAFAALVHSLAGEADLPLDRVILGGDHLGPYPWRERGSAVAMERAAEMVRAYVEAGYVKIHLDASMRCADDPQDLPEEVAAARTADLAAAAEAASAPPGFSGPFFVIGTEVPLPGGQAAGHGGPAVTRAEDAERTLALVRRAFAERGLERAFERVLALVVQPGVDFGDEAVFPYRRAEAGGLRAFAEKEERVVFEAHSTDYQDEADLRALVEDHFAFLKVGPELTFAFREAVFALAAIEHELLAGRGPLSDLRGVVDAVMRRDPTHWSAYYRGDEDVLRLRRQFSRSDRIRYYWSHPEVEKALLRLIANLEGRPLPPGLLGQYLPLGLEATPGPDLPRRLVRLRIRRVLDRYARACGETAVAAGGERP